MALTGSALLAQFLGTSGLGFKAKSDDPEAKRIADRLNTLRAENSLYPDRGKGSGHSGTNEEIAALIRRMDLVDGAKKRVGGNAVDTGDTVSGYEVFNLDPMSREEIEAKLPKGFSFDSFGRIEADMTAGNTQEQRDLARRLRDNLIGGKEYGYTEPAAVQTPLDPIAVYGGQLPELRIDAGDSEFTKMEKKRIFEEQKAAIKDELLGKVADFQGKMKNPDTRIQEQGRRAFQETVGILEQLGFSDTGKELQTALHADEIKDPTQVPATMTAEQGSAAALAKAKEQILRGRTPQQIAAYNRAYPGKTNAAQPTLHRGSQQYGAGTPTGFGSGVKTDAAGNFVSGGAQAPTKPEADVSGSRNAVVQDLMKQGITDPNQLLNFLNFDEQGNQVGDFTIDEVESLMGGATPEGTPPGTPPGTPGAPTGAPPSTTSAAISSVIAAIAKTDPTTAAFLQNVQTILGQRMNMANAGLLDDTQRAEAEFQEYQTLSQDIIDRSKNVYDVAKILREQTAGENINAAFSAMKSGMAQNDLTRLQETININRTKRDSEKAHAKKINSMATRVAVAGGFGSMNLQREIEEVDAEGEMEISRWTQESFSILNQKHLTTSLKLESDYTSKVAEIKTNLANELLDSLAKHNQTVDDAKKFSLGGLVKRNDRFEKAKTEWRNEWKSIQEKAITEHKDAIKTYRDGQVSIREEMRKEEKAGTDLLDWATDTYGNDIPPSILNMIQKRAPDIDVKEVLAHRTIEQKKMKGGGGVGGVGSGFSISQRDSKGDPIAMEKFIEQKENDWRATLPDSPFRIFEKPSEKQKQAWEKEYNAKLADDSYLSAEQLEKEWRVKQAGGGNFPSVAQMEATDANFHDALRRGAFQEARDIIDGVGPKPPETTVARVTSAERILNDLIRMEALLDRVEDDVGAFPTKGALWEFVNENIETSPVYAELKQLADSNLAPYSRGISGDKGATTEPDVERALSSLLDPRVDAPAARAALQQAKRQAHESITIYLKGMRDAGYRVKAMQDTYSSGSYNTSDPSLPQDPEWQEWFNNQ